MQVWSKLFAKSPFKPLIKHAEVVIQTVETLEKAIELWERGEYETMREYARKVDDLEDFADRIKEEIRDSLSSKLFMPVNRGDILRYLHMQDKIADAAEDTAKWLLVKKPDGIPMEVKKCISEMAGESIKAAKLVYDAIVQMDIVIESGFSETEIKKEYEIVKAIESVENRIDDFDTKLMQYVFEHEEEISWGMGMYILNIARTLSNISDKAKDSAERIRLMMNK
ncbi:TIGR00153 family protein [Thermococci archaeon]|uniref:TIGR00153 family protein n=1 Tax=Palaeococcus sp. (in: euryarchaeotes) TaxID=2820298 RepID=UPI000F16AA6B|nr:TIGR00153 family protein [Palaeococcus sp. (in: euryarchaeotes)]MCD6559268.1 TIGR00153 family protein [Palaeococcus sp. (in: euryarchaeotes)]RLF87827.1 MAG: TIGR00153 family protein [Thermococci archaeon]